MTSDTCISSAFKFKNVINKIHNEQEKEKEKKRKKPKAKQNNDIYPRKNGL